MGETCGEGVGGQCAYMILETNIEIYFKTVTFILA